MNDTISRQAAIDVILSIDDYGNSDRANALGLAEFKITTLPTAEPQEGEWEEISTSEAKVTLQYMRCSACKRWHIVPYLYKVTLSNYCPNCGADMRGNI